MTTQGTALRGRMDGSRPMIIDGGRVIDPARGVDGPGALGVAKGRMVDPGQIGDGRRIDLDGLVVCPGFIDLHVHLRDPGQTWKEDLVSGTMAAAVGGFSTVAAMPNTIPPLDTPERVSALRRRAAESAFVRVLPTACITLGREGAEPTDPQALKTAGAVALTDDGGCVPSNRVMLEAMRRAAGAGLPVLDHCEDPDLVDEGVLNESPIAERLRVPGRPAAAEELIAARDILLARTAGCRVHLQHLSTAGAVELLRWAAARRIQVSAEVTPHHLTMTEVDCLRLGAMARMNPPLRTEEDREALVRAAVDGRIAAIATDHAPHSQEEKSRPLHQAPAGIIGLETAIPVCLTALVHSGRMTLAQFVARFTAGPRRVLGLAQGTLAPGAPADITILDPDAEHVINPDAFRSKSRNTPFAGMRCRGKPVAVMVGGRWVWSLVPEITGRALIDVGE